MSQISPPSKPVSPPPAPPRVPPLLVVRIANAVVEGLEGMKNKLLPPQAVLLNMTAGGMMTSILVCMAGELGIADHLKDGPRTVEELAQGTGTDAPSLFRVLRALASLGIFAERNDGRFELTPLAEYLRSDVPGSMRPWARYGAAEWQWNLWSALIHTVRNGKTFYENEHQMRFFEWFEKRPDASAIFDGAMSSMSTLVNPAIVAGYDFSGVGSLVDVAGGEGSLLAGILRANPHLKGTLFDQPHVVVHARDVRSPELSGRCEVVGGNFFESVPTGHDAYLLKWIIHDWSDEESLVILRNCRRAMERGKRLLLVEMVLQPGNEPFFGKLMDIAMMLTTGGRERTEAEYRTLYGQAGFSLERVVPTASPFCIVEGIAV